MLLLAMAAEWSRAIEERTVGGGAVFLLPFADRSEEELLAGAGLSAAERERYAQFPVGAVQRRKEWLAARVLVRQKLGGRIGYDSFGRPVPEGGPVAENRHISIAHTRGWAALMATYGRRCGVDIERTTRDAARTIVRAASAEELRLATVLFPANPALLVWCAKEAAYKAVGQAGMDFRTQIILTGRAGGGRLSASVSGEGLTLEFFETDGLLVVGGPV